MQQLHPVKALPPPPAVLPAQVDPSSVVALESNPVPKPGSHASQKSSLRQIEMNRIAPVAAFARRTRATSSSEDLWTIRLSADSDGGAKNQVYKRTAGQSEWHPVTISDGVNFQAVSAAEREVWAGGDHGALFHSADDGLHWERISVTTLSAKLTESIVRIDAHDPGRVQLTTSTGDVWVRQNGLWRRNTD